MQRVLHTINQLLQQPGERKRFFKYWFLVFSFLVVLPNVGFILEILFNQPILSIPERLALVLSLYGNSLRFLFEPVTFSIVMLSIVLALNFQLIRFIRHHQQQASGRLKSTAAMLISGHCVACGGSLLAPILSLFTGSGSYFSSERYWKLQIFAVLLNLIAMYIAYRSMKKAAGPVLLLTQPARVT